MNTTTATSPSEPATVVVAGDICLDVLGYPIPPSPKSENSSEENWRQTGETRTFYRRGGTWLLADFVRAALKRGELTGNVVEPVAPVIQSDDDFERLTRHEIVHSLLGLRVFTDKIKNKEDCECEVRRIRVAETHGFSGPSKPNIPTLQATLQGDVPNPDLVILDDTGNRFRHEQTLWPTAIKAEAPASRPLVIYKLHRPLPKSQTSSTQTKNELWEKVRSMYGRRTIVVVNVDDLRDAGAVISRRLSWERTALELVWQLNGGAGSDRLAELRRCPHLIIRLGLEGAVYWCNPGNDETPRAWLVYDPTAIEGDWDDQHAGTMVGYGSAFVAGFAATLLASEGRVELQRLRDGSILDTGIAPKDGSELKDSLPQLERGLKRGLLASRSLLTIGYGTPPEDKDPTPAYLAEEVFAALTDKDEAAFATISIPISNDLLNADPDHWSILNSRLADGKLVERVAEVATRWKKANKHPEMGATLATLPRGVFGKLVTYDRGEIEAYRAVSNLVREYLSQLAPKRPLCLAVFGPPGSGKSFGVEQVSASIAERTGAKIVKLTFNLSQFSADGDELSRALHLVRDAVLRGNVPLVFFDEFDSSVGGIERHWLKQLLAPMQDGEFLDQGSIHPLGRAIFVFAGGTSHSYEKFVPKERANDGTETVAWKDFVKAKGPDFVSRLRGVLDIPGIDFDPSGNCAAAALRRAGILRFQLWDKARHLFDTAGTLQIDEEVLRAFLNVRRFHHGIRSLEALLDMSQLGGSSRFDAGSLPHPRQLELHVVAQTNAAVPTDIGFINIIHHAPPFPIERRERIARAIHEDYLIQRRKDGKHDPKEASHQEWDNLNEFYRDSNRAQADDIPRKLQSNGYRIVDANAAGTAAVITGLPDKLIEELAQREHDRWVAERESQGWRYGETRDNSQKLHPALLKWDDPDPHKRLPDVEKEKDRDAIRALAKSLQAGGYVIVK